MITNVFLICISIFVYRVDHHRWWRECAPSVDRGHCEGGAALHLQLHAHWRQEEVPLHAAHIQGEE